MDQQEVPREQECGKVFYWTSWHEWLDQLYREGKLKHWNKAASTSSVFNAMVDVWITADLSPQQADEVFTEWAANQF